MSFGIRTFSGNGTVQLDTSLFTYQLIYNQLHAVDGTNTLQIPIAGFDPAKCSAVMLPLGVVEGEFASQAMPLIFQSVGMVTIRSRPEGSNSRGSQITFRLIVMRFRN